MFISLEGLDGVGKSTLLKNTSDTLYDTYGYSSYIFSPTNESKELKEVISDTSLTPFMRFQESLKIHSSLLDSLKEYHYKVYDFILLDRSIHSAFAYSLFNEIDSHKKQIALVQIKKLEEKYNLSSFFIEIDEFKRQFNLNNRFYKSFFDNSSKENSEKIQSLFYYLIKNTSLKKIDKELFINELFKKDKAKVS